MLRTAELTALCLVLSGLPVYAADGDAEQSASEASAKAFVKSVNLSVPSVEFTPFAAPPALPTAKGLDRSFQSRPFEKPASRPRALPALYVSLAALQAFDAYSTARGLSSGAQEGNPIMQHVARNTVGFVALKAATAVVPMVLAERMWKHNKVGAIALMVAANGVAAVVGANNARVLHQLP
ncbi:MAG: DUF5658 family protein [Vicinamibacterales bacterium]